MPDLPISGRPHVEDLRRLILLQRGEEIIRRPRLERPELPIGGDPGIEVIDHPDNMVETDATELLHHLDDVLTTLRYQEDGGVKGKQPSRPHTDTIAHLEAQRTWNVSGGENLPRPDIDEGGPLRESVGI